MPYVALAALVIGGLSDASSKRRAKRAAAQQQDAIRAAALREQEALRQEAAQQQIILGEQQRRDAILAQAEEFNELQLRQAQGPELDLGPDANLNVAATRRRRQQFFNLEGDL